MALSFDTSSKILVIFLSCLAFDTMCSTKLFLGAKADLIDDVCSQTTIDPQFCKTDLHSDPRSSGAGLSTLAQIAIDLAQSHTKSAITLVTALEKNATDPKLKEIYGSCLVNYDDTNDYLNDCTEALNAEDYGTLNIRGSAALDGPGTCDDNFSQSPEPSELLQYSKNVQALSSAICAIANRLLGRLY